MESVLLILPVIHVQEFQSMCMFVYSGTDSPLLTV